MAIRITIVDFPHVPVVRVHGELDGLAAGEFRSAIEAACPQDCDRFAVDLSEVEYIESAAIGALIEAHVAIQARGGRLAVTCSRRNIAKMLRLSGLGHVMPMFEDVHAAVAFLSQ
jgi:anti-anti-sigma factor